MLSNRFSIVPIIVLASIVMVNSALGQIIPRPSPLTQSKQMFGPPLFLYDTCYFRSQKDSTNYRLDVYVAFSNDILQFIKEKQGNFIAGYDLYITIFDHKGNHVAEKLAGNRITVSTFEETNNRELKNRHRLSFDLIPGQYKLVLDLTDYDTQKSLHREKEITIKGFEINEISVSDILFADQVLLDSLNNTIKEILPNLDRNFINPKSIFWAFFEIYPLSSSQILKLTYTITNASEQAIIRKEQLITPDKRIIPYLLDLSKDIKTPGRYTIIVQVEQVEEKVKTQAKFSVNWSNFEFSKLNVITAIEALKDFIPDKEYRYLEQASDSAKETWFNNFWKERDPIPDTEENELQKEFYQRIDFTNNYFTVNSLDKEGWKTDRGNIYIKYGPPTDVERHLDQLNLPPYEIWYYEKLDQRFFFEDKSGVGDFHLVRIE